MRFIRRMAWVCTLIGLMLSLGSAMAASQAQEAPARGFDMHPREGYYLSYGSCLQHVRLDGTVTAQREDFALVRLMDARDQALYVLDEQQGAPVLMKLDENLNTTYAEPLPFKGYYVDFAVLEPYVYVITTDETGAATRLCEFNMETRASEILEDVSQPQCIDAGKSKVGLVCESPAGLISCLALLRPDEKLIDVVAEDQYGREIVMLDDESCLLTDYNGNTATAAVRWDGGSLSARMVSIGGGQLQWMAASDQGVGIYRAEEGAVQLLASESLWEQQRRLTIFSDIDQSSWTPAIERFTAENPDIQVVFREYPNLDALKLAVMAGEDDLDVLITNSYVGAHFMRGDVAEDLAAWPAFQRLLETEGFNRTVFDLTRLEGAQYAAPVNFIAPEVCALHLPLFGKLGLALPTSAWTWADLEDMADAAQRAGCYLLDSYNVPWIQPFMAAGGVMTGDMSALHTQEFAAMCERWKDWHQRGLIAQGGESEGNALIRFVEMSPGETTGEQIFLPMPALAPWDTPAAADCGVYIVLQSSDNKEPALELLSSYFSRDTWKLDLDPVLWGYADAWQRVHADELAHSLGETIVAADQPALELLIGEAGGAVLKGVGRELTRYVQRSLNAFVQDEISLESLVAQLDQQLVMMLLE